METRPFLSQTADRETGLKGVADFQLTISQDPFHEYCTIRVAASKCL